MKWLVALGSRSPALEPLSLLRFLKQSKVPQRFCAVSVCSANQTLDQSAQQAALEAYLTEHAHDLEFDEVSIKSGGHRHQMVESAAQEWKAGAIVLARQTMRTSADLPRLARLPRRLLRSSSVPVVVVPPAMVAPLGSGPIVVAVARRDHSCAPVVFAQTLARELGREVELISVVPEPASPGWAPLYEAPDVVAHRRAERTIKVQQELTQWLEESGISDIRIEIRIGTLLEELLRFASEKDAPLLVCGKRRLSKLSRFMAGGTGSDLATYARIPVAMVPLLPTDSD